jgi:hypothetical protein
MLIIPSSISGKALLSGRQTFFFGNQYEHILTLQGRLYPRLVRLTTLAGHHGGRAFCDGLSAQRVRLPVVQKEDRANITAGFMKVEIMRTSL